MTRRIENSIEVPGTPEEVWEAIATGPGIESVVRPRRGSRAGGWLWIWATAWRTRAM